MAKTMLSYSHTPIQQLHSPLFERAELTVLVKREDLNHPFVSGNKWWKLKYNLEEAKNLGFQNILTFGGAYSNHIYATAAAAKELGFQSIGIIRGDETPVLNSTLTFAKSCGMQLHFVSRQTFRSKTEQDFIQELHHQIGKFYLIPEGGTNDPAIRGVEEFAHLLKTEKPFDYLCSACGTGGTLAGLIRGLPEKKIIGIAVLKGDFLGDEVNTLVGSDYSNWNILGNYHFGGYAKFNGELITFMKSFEKNFSIPLEQVYTAKMFYGLFDLIEKGFFARNSTVLAVHTGGLQGRMTV